MREMTVSGPTPDFATSKGEVGQPEKGRRQRQFEDRERRQLEAQEAAAQRAERGREKTLAERIEEANRKLDSNVAGSRAYLDSLSMYDLNIALLAEELGRKRKGVLQGYPTVSRALREQFEQETGLEAPSGVSETAHGTENP